MDQVTVPNKLAVIGPLLSIFSTAPQHNFYDQRYDNFYDLHEDHFYDQQCLPGNNSERARGCDHWPWRTENQEDPLGKQGRDKILSWKER